MDKERKDELLGYATRLDILRKYIRATEYDPDILAVLVILDMIEEALDYKRRQKEKSDEYMKKYNERHAGEGGMPNVY